MTELCRVEVMSDILSFDGGGKKTEIQEKKKDITFNLPFNYQGLHQLVSPFIILRVAP